MESTADNRVAKVLSTDSIITNGYSLLPAQGIFRADPA